MPYNKVIPSEDWFVVSSDKWIHLKYHHKELRLGASYAPLLPNQSSSTSLKIPPLTGRLLWLPWGTLTLTLSEFLAPLCFWTKSHAVLILLFPQPDCQIGHPEHRAPGCLTLQWEIREGWGYGFASPCPSPRTSYRVSSINVCKWTDG